MLVNHVPTVQRAAKRHGVPWFVMAGVWWLETRGGTNVHTSTAGAEGDFQFLPETAQRYRYPLTNAPTDAQFATQADAAASYLADLRRQRGSWDAALRAYSGGGYGLDEVKKGAASFQHNAPGPPTHKFGDDVLTGPSGGPGGLLTGPTRVAAKAAQLTGLDALAKFLGFLMQPKTWLRVVELIGGLVVGFLAIKQLAAAASQGAS